MVIKIIDENKGNPAYESRGDNKIEYKVIPTSTYKDEEKRIKDAYTELLKEWQDLKKSDPQAPRPVKPIIKKLKTGYQTQKIAQEYADKLRDEELEKEDSKSGAPNRK